MLDKNSRYLLYNSFFEPHIRYLIACYGNANLESLNKLQRLQNKAIKTIFSLNYYTPIEIIYKNYPFLKINKIKQHEQAKLIYKIKYNQIKTNVNLKQNKDYHNYQLRTREKLRNNHSKTKKTQNSPIYRSIVTFNKLPSYLFQGREESVIHNLKKYLKTETT